MATCDVDRAMREDARARRAVRLAWEHCADWDVGSPMWRFNFRRLLLAAVHLDRRSRRLAEACVRACVERGRRRVAV